MSVQETPPVAPTTPSSAPAAESKFRAILGNQLTVLVAVIIVLYVFFAIRNGRFFTIGESKNLIVDFSGLILLAIAETFVIISGGIDLSVSSTVGVAGVVAAKVMGHYQGHMGFANLLLLGTGVSILVGLIVGGLNAFMITVINLVPFVATLITLSAGAGVALVISGGGDVGFNPSTGLWSSEGLGPLTYESLIVLVIMVMFCLSLHFTRYGRINFAIGSNSFAARAAGINVKRHIASVYIWAGILSGLVGMFYYIRIGTGSPITGQNSNLTAIACVVIGGVALIGGSGSVLGTILGAIILTLIGDGLIFVNVQPTWDPVVVGAFILVAVTLQQFRGKFSIPGLKPLRAKASAK